MATLLNTIEMPNGWTVEEYNSADRAYVREASAPAGLLGRFTATLHRVPSRRTTRVFYMQGTTVEERTRALVLAKNATGPYWRKSAKQWWKKRAKNGRYRFFAAIGQIVDVEEAFADLVAQLDTSTQHTIPTNCEATA